MISGLPRLAVFDLDGTLVDSAHMITAAMADAFSRIDLAAPPAAEVRRVVGLPLEDAIARLAPGLDGDGCRRLGDHYKSAFFALREAGSGGEEIFAGAETALDAMAMAGWNLGIATGKSHRGLTATLETFDLTARFVTLQTADRGPGKPAPDMLFRAMAEAGAVAETTVMIGDTSFDMEMACAAGVAAIGVAWGNHGTEELFAAGARDVATDFAAVPPAALAALDGGVVPGPGPGVR